MTESPPSPDAPASLFIYTRPGCHLCDDLLTRWVAACDRQGLPGANALPAKRDITGNPSWLAIYRDRIPVLTWGGQVLLEGRPTNQQVEEAVALFAGDV